jgi:hypothetical protein
MEAFVQYVLTGEHLLMLSLVAALTTQWNAGTLRQGDA